MFEQVFCVNCKQLLGLEVIHCPRCGTDQRPPRFRPHHDLASRSEPLEITKAGDCSQDESEKISRATSAALDEQADRALLDLEARLRNMPHLRLLGHRFVVTDKSGRFAIGVVKNESNEACLEALVQVNSVDKDDAVIGTASEHARCLLPYQTWKFVIALPADAEGYRVTELCGDYQSYRDDAEFQRRTLARDSVTRVTDAMNIAEDKLRYREAEQHAIIADQLDRERNCVSYGVWISFPF
jgi:hypothetical protein